MSHLHFRNISRYGFLVWMRVILLFMYGRIKDAFLFSHTTTLHFICGMIEIGWSITIIQYMAFSFNNISSPINHLTSASIWASGIGVLGLTQLLIGIFFRYSAWNSYRAFVTGLSISLWSSITVASIIDDPISSEAVAYGTLTIALTWALVRELLEYGPATKQIKR